MEPQPILSQFTINTLGLQGGVMNVNDSDGASVLRGDDGKWYSMREVLECLAALAKGRAV